MTELERIDRSMVGWFSHHADMCAEQAKWSLGKMDRRVGGLESDWVDLAHSWALSWKSAMEWLEEHHK